MRERIVMFNDFFTGTLGANVTRYLQFDAPVSFLYAEGLASNDSSATLALSGAGGLSIAAQAIGDSGAFRKIVPASSDVKSEPANSLITVTLDYDGSSGTAAENVHLLLFFLHGENPS